MLPFPVDRLYNRVIAWIYLPAFLHIIDAPTQTQSGRLEGFRLMSASARHYRAGVKAVLEGAVAALESVLNEPAR